MDHKRIEPVQVARETLSDRQTLGRVLVLHRMFSVDKTSKKAGTIRFVRNRGGAGGRPLPLLTHRVLNFKADSLVVSPGNEEVLPRAGPGPSPFLSLAEQFDRCCMSPGLEVALPYPARVRHHYSAHLSGHRRYQVMTLR